MSSTDAIVLSYNECLLRESDVELLRGPHWLNDSIISFYFEYLQSDLFSDCPQLLFVAPEVTQCIKISPLGDIGVFLDPLVSNIQRDFIFFALNDNESTESSGGSHWSLLVFSRPECTVFHYDSSNGSNQMPAIELSQKILKFFSMETIGRIDSMECLQQNNGYDCGVHVMCNAEHLGNYASHYKMIRGCPKMPYESVIAKRWEVLDIINKLRNKNYTYS
nr:unnamed protein product [Callosobruchus chinensis]